MTITLTDAERLAARALEHAGTAAAAAASVAKALARAEADGLSSHGLARIPAYCAQVRSGKVDGSAVPRLVPLGPSGARVDAGYGFALPCPGPRDRRGGRARRRDLRCRCGRDPLASLRGRRPPCRAGRRARPDRADRRQLAGRDRALGRPAGAARHQSDRVRVPTPRGAAAGDRRLARQGRARQGDAGGAARRADSRRLGARCARAADHRCQGRARRHHAAAGRCQGRCAGADGRDLGGGAYRRQLRRRGELPSSTTRGRRRASGSA